MSYRERQWKGSEKVKERLWKRNAKAVSYRDPGEQVQQRQTSVVDRISKGDHHRNRARNEGRARARIIIALKHANNLVQQARQALCRPLPRPRGADEPSRIERTEQSCSRATSIGDRGFFYRMRDGTIDDTISPLFLISQEPAEIAAEPFQIQDWRVPV